jgi:hypothetical protein
MVHYPLDRIIFAIAWAMAKVRLEPIGHCPGRAASSPARQKSRRRREEISLHTGPQDLPGRLRTELS